MKSLGRIFDKFTRNTRKEAVKRDHNTTAPWMHEQVKRVLARNYQAVVTNK